MSYQASLCRHRFPHAPECGEAVHGISKNHSLCWSSKMVELGRSQIFNLADLSFHAKIEKPATKLGETPFTHGENDKGYTGGVNCTVC